MDSLTLRYGLIAVAIGLITAGLLYSIFALEVMSDARAVETADVPFLLVNLTDMTLASGECHCRLYRVWAESLIPGPTIASVKLQTCDDGKDLVVVADARVEQSQALVLGDASICVAEVEVMLGGNMEVALPAPVYVDGQLATPPELMSEITGKQEELFDQYASELAGEARKLMMLGGAALAGAILSYAGAVIISLRDSS